MPLGGFWCAVQIKRSYAEHLSRPLAVVCCDYGRVSVHKAVLGKKTVQSLSRRGTYLKHRLKGVRTHTQVRYGTQIIKSVGFFLQRIIGGGRPLDCNFIGVYLKFLFGVRSEYHPARNGYRRSGVEL